MMNSYPEAILDIPYRKENKSEINVPFSICKVTPAHNPTNTYHTPFKRLGLNDVWQVNNMGIRTINTVSNTPTHTVGLATGSEDVDYVYAMYTDHPEWFEGSSEAAFKNTDSVINLALNLLSKDYYTLFETAYNSGYCNRHVWEMIRDIMRDVGIRATPDERPLFPLSYHLELIKDYMTEKYNNRQNDGSLTKRTDDNTGFNSSSGSFSKYIFGQPSEDNTINFIRQCMTKGGVGLLITYLNAMYGSLVIRREI